MTRRNTSPPRGSWPTPLPPIPGWPRIGGSTSLDAACAAALAGCGQSRDDKLPESRCEGEAPRAGSGLAPGRVAAWTKVVESGTAIERRVVAKTLEHWRQDSDLAGIRNAKALEALPEAERKGLAGAVG